MAGVAVRRGSEIRFDISKNRPDSHRPAEVIHTVQLQRKWVSRNLELRNRNSANATWDARIEKSGSGKVVEGVAKRPVLKGDKSTSAENLGLTEMDASYNAVARENPRMLARQVASWKVAKALGWQDILAHERFAKDDYDGSTIGVSELVPNATSLQDLLLNSKPEARRLLQSPEIQERLSRLQILDAIVGQTDRHNGNIMINPETGEVKGIDNDQSFPVGKANSWSGNQVTSWIKETYPKDESVVQDESEYPESSLAMVGVGAAKDVSKLNPKSLEKILAKVQSDDGSECLTPSEIGAARVRLIAIQKHLAEMRKSGDLIGKGMRIEEWGEKANTKAQEIEKIAKDPRSRTLLGRALGKI